MIEPEQGFHPQGMGPGKKDVAILVVSCDAYQDLWKPFFECFFRSWADCPYPIFLGSNNLRYEDARVQSICVGPDKGYSSNLLVMLSQITQDWILIFVEDVFLVGAVDTLRIERMIAFARKANAGIVQLLYRPFNLHHLLPKGKLGSEEVFELPPGVPYRVSINVCLCRKTFIMEILRPGESAWDLESQGTIRSFNSPSPCFLIARKRSGPLFHWVHGVIKRKWTWEAARLVRRRGHRINLEHRSIQAFSSFVYLRLYTFLRYCAFWFVYNLWGKGGMMKLVAVRKTGRL